MPLLTALTPQEFLQPYVLQGEFLYTEQVNYNGVSYTLAFVNASETFVLSPSGSSYQFINHTPTVYAILLQRSLDRLDLSTDMASLRSDLASFQSSRQQRQHDCEVTTGTDALPCYNQDSCYQACFSVPACRTYNQGTGGELSNTILTWRQTNSQLDGNLTDYSSQLNIISNKTSQIQIATGAAINDLDRALSAVSTIRSNSIFNECPTCYNYCIPIPFNSSALNHSRSTISSIQAQVPSSAQLQSTAEALVAQTSQRIADSEFRSYSENLTSRYQQILAEAQPLAYLHDAVIENDLAHLNSTIEQVRANGSLRRYNSAYSLRDFFTRTADHLEGRITELSSASTRYATILANLTTERDRSNAVADQQLALINDSELLSSKQRINQIYGQFIAFGNSSQYDDAFELQDDFDIEAQRIRSRADNVSITFIELTEANRTAFSALNSTRSLLRPNDSFWSNYLIAEATYNASLSSLGPPAQGTQVAEIRSNFTSVNAQSDSLFPLIQAQHRKDDANSLKLHLVALFEKLLRIHS